MKTLLRMTAVAVGLLLAVATAHAQGINNLKTFTLSNGLTVWLNEDHARPIVFGAVVVKAGAADCPGSGIAHYFEHIMFKGTRHIGTTDYEAERPWIDSISAQYDLLARTADAHERQAIQRHINSLSIQAAQWVIPNEFSNLIATYGGSRLNAYTSFDETVFHNWFAPQYIGQWCELNSERMLDPVFRMFQSELEAVYEEKNMYADNMLMGALTQVERRLFAGTPYASPILGETDSLKNPRLSEMTDFFRRYYVAGNMGLMLSGDISADSLRPLLERTFGRIRPGTAPARQRSVLPDFSTMQPVEVKIPIPIVKAEALLYKAPMESDSDYAAFQVMQQLLTNSAETGLIDSLTTAGDLMMAMGQSGDLKDFSLYGYGFVPELPFGSRKKAEAKCMEQVERLKQGLFSDDMLTAEKLTLKRDLDLELETVEGRSKAMINAFSHGVSWQQVAQRSSRIDSVTRQDIMRVARRFLTADALRVVKAFGHYDKEHVSQPEYRPVRPKNSGRQSAYARQLAAMPYRPAEPRLIDFGSDVSRDSLAPLVSLYTTPNADNDVFTLSLIYRRGFRNDPRLDLVADYLGMTGAGRLDRHAFNLALRRLGATLETDASTSSVTLTLTGLDRNLAPTLSLLHELLVSPRADKRQFKRLMDAARVADDAFFEDNSEVAGAVIEYAARGSRSDRLCRTTMKEAKVLGADGLLHLFADLQQSQLDIVYCGSHSARDVAAILSREVPLSQVSHPWQSTEGRLRPVTENTVYLYDNPKARQTIIATLQTTPPLADSASRGRFRLWGNYFGRGMQSVLFQDIREFRSLAYSVGASLAMPDIRLHAGEPCAYITRLGTQADKAMEAIVVLDSLLSDMPVRPANLDAARQAIVNGINNSFPDKRAIGRVVADDRLSGYTYDPSRDILDALRPLTLDDMTAFYRAHIQHAPRAYIIVGDKRQLDLPRLQRLGRLVELKPADIYRK